MLLLWAKLPWCKYFPVNRDARLGQQMGTWTIAPSLARMPSWTKYRWSLGMYFDVSKDPKAMSWSSVNSNKMLWRCCVCLVSLSELASTAKVNVRTMYVTKTRRIGHSCRSLPLNPIEQLHRDLVLLRVVSMVKSNKNQKGAIDMSDEILLTLGSVMSRSSRRTAPWSSPFALEIWKWDLEERFDTQNLTRGNDYFE